MAVVSESVSEKLELFIDSVNNLATLTLAVLIIKAFRDDGHSQMVIELLREFEITEEQIPGIDELIQELERDELQNDEVFEDHVLYSWLCWVADQIE